MIKLPDIVLYTKEIKMKNSKVLTFEDIHQPEYYNKLALQFELNNKCAIRSKKLINIVRITDDDQEGITKFNAALVDRSKPQKTRILFNDLQGRRYAHVKCSHLSSNALMALAKSQPDGVILPVFIQYDKTHKIMYLYEYLNDMNKIKEATRVKYLNKGV